MMNHEEAMGEARVLSKASTCTKRQVGAIVLKDNVVVGSGVNGPPEGVSCPFGKGSQEEDTVCIHAEERALEGLKVPSGLSRAESREVEGASLADTIFSTWFPCPACMELLAKAGIRLVVFMEEPHPSHVRYDRYAASKRLASKEGVNMVRYPPTI